MAGLEEMLQGVHSLPAWPHRSCVLAVLVSQRGQGQLSLVQWGQGSGGN